MEDLFGLDDIDESGDEAAATLAENYPPIAVGRANTQEPVVRFSNTGRVPIQREPSPNSLEPLAPPPRTRPGVQPAAVRKTAPVSIAPATQKPVRRDRRLDGRAQQVRAVVDGDRPVAARGRWCRRRVVRDDPAADDDGGQAGGAGRDRAGDREVRRHARGLRGPDRRHRAHRIAVDHRARGRRPPDRDPSQRLHRVPDVARPRANDKHSLHIELRPLGTTGSTGEATLSVSSTPSGLEAELDGVMLPEHTPIKLPIKPGSHTIVLKKNGAEVWRQTVNAEASSDIELNPSFTATVPPKSPARRRSSRPRRTP